MNKTDKKIKMVKLGDVVDINPRFDNSISIDSTVSFVPMAGVSENGCLLFEESRKLDEVKKGYRYFQRGDVLLAKITPCMENGKASPTNLLENEIGFGSTEFHVLRATEQINWRYLFYMVWNDLFRANAKKKMTGAAGQKRISTAFLSSYKIPLPPLAEQKRIAEILDLADEARRKRKKNLALYDDLIRSLFLKTFGDPVNNQYNFSRGTIRELINEVKYGTSKKADTSKGEYPVLRMGNITYDGNWNFSSLKYCDLEKEELDKYLVHNGDMLFNRTNSRELVGKTAVFREKNPMAYAGYLIRVRPNKYANIEFLSAHLNSKWAKQYLSAKCKSIVGMANINAQELQDIPILIPPLDLQNQFAKQVEEINQQKAREQALYDQHDNLFNALLQRAFKEML